MFVAEKFIRSLVSIMEKDTFHDFEVSDIKNSIIMRSRIIRADLKRAKNTGHTDSLRIFRQGYEFVEQINEQPGFRWGLNVVNFQSTPDLNDYIKYLLRQNGLEILILEEILTLLINQGQTLHYQEWTDYYLYVLVEYI
jgi:hypothetical protein